MKQFVERCLLYTCLANLTIAYPYYLETVTSESMGTRKHELWGHAQHPSCGQPIKLAISHAFVLCNRSLYWQAQISKPIPTRYLNAKYQNWLSAVCEMCWLILCLSLSCYRYTSNLPSFLPIWGAWQSFRLYVNRSQKESGLVIAQHANKKCVSMLHTPLKIIRTIILRPSKNMYVGSPLS